MKKIFTLLSIVSVSAANLLAQVTPNPSFDTWTHNTFPSYDDPNGWNTANAASSILGAVTVYKATVAADIHSGASAVKLVTKNIAGNLAPGIVTTGTIPTSTSGSITGGIAYTLRPDSIVGYYKYAPQGADRGFFELRLLGSGGESDTVAVAHFNTLSSNVTTYTRFAKALTYYSSNAVVTARWLISSSVDGTNAIVGSTMFADDINVVFAPTTSVKENEKSDLTVGPNPAYGNLTIRNTASIEAVFNLYDVTGRKLVSEKIVNATNSIDVTSVPVGIYLYSITDEKNNKIKTGKLILQK